MGARYITLDGNEAAARIAHLTNEVIAIYPITPASPMGEHADHWSANGQPNLWGSVPEIVEMQSEAGAAGAIHGALQAGALTTTFTASQGLMLMLPNMYKIAGELTPTVFHIAARSLAAQALSIFCDHNDVMAARGTGFAILAANSVQEVLDFALISQAATLKSRVPFLHFFDGFRTSHEINKVSLYDNDVIVSLLDDDDIEQHRSRSLSPEHPVLRGSSQNPDVYFQARESVNKYYRDVPPILQAAMDSFARQTGRQYRLFDYEGTEDAERVMVIMGSGAEAAIETVAHLRQQGEKVGVLVVRLYRPFAARQFVEALPGTVRTIAVLDRCKEPGSDGEPLYKDVATALYQHLAAEHLPKVIAGRYGLSSKEFNPGMIKAVFDELKKDSPRHPFTIGIDDDVTHLSLDWDDAFQTDANRAMQAAVFYGLGSDGTVSANKNSIRIIGEQTDHYAQGYFVYDSKKSGAVTVSHLRFGPDVIRSSYLIGDGQADFVACHQTVFLERYDMLAKAKQGAVFLLNTPVAPEQAWQSLPANMQRRMIDYNIGFHIIDAYRIARDCGLGRRINTIMQACFFAIANVLEKDRALAAIKAAARAQYAKAGEKILSANLAAIDSAVQALVAIDYPDKVDSLFVQPESAFNDATDFARNFTQPIFLGQGDRLPVSVFPPDGTYPTGTAQWEKRNIAMEIPVWEGDICTQCGKCVFVCPHSVIRSKLFPADLLATAPPGFKSEAVRSKDYPQGYRMSYQVAPEDCTGCGLCVDVCPIRDRQNPARKALNMAPQPPLREQEKANWKFFSALPDYDPLAAKIRTIPGAMLRQPLFEFSGACEGCGETPYLRLATQLFGDRMLVANATGCSSIYGGNLPTTPWTKNSDGRGPAWSNSLFEDNAEFGFGMRIASDKLNSFARELLIELQGGIDSQLADAILNNPQTSEAEIFEQRELVGKLRVELQKLASTKARQLLVVADYLVKRSVWLVGGDGWAYDIGFGGLDHVLASGRNVNILVLDTEVYSNTGGQTSKATPRAAVAKFSAGGKTTMKKDLARIAMCYEDVYVAQVAFGAKDTQTLRTFIEAEAYDGPSLIIAYSPCIAHGVDLKRNLTQQDLAIRSGHWPLFRFDPAKSAAGRNPLHLDSKPPSIPYRDYALSEARFNVLLRTHPHEAERLLELAQKDAEQRYRYYRRLAESAGEAETAEGNEHG